MRIALVNTSLEKERGSDIVVHDLASRLAQRHEVTVYLLRATADTARNYKVVMPGPARGIGRITQVWSMLRRIAREAPGYDVINSHHALVSLLLPKKRLVTTYHGYRGRLNLTLGRQVGGAISEFIRRVPVRRALRRSRAVALVSGSLIEEVKESGRANWEVIHNGVAQLPDYPSRQPSYFLYLGRLDPDKSVGALLAAYERSAISVPLVVVGDGVERAHLQARYTGSKFHFLGKRSRAELPELFVGAFGFVTASEFETFCLPVIEAAQFGCPAVGPASGALPEVIRPGITGLLAEPGLLSEKIEALWRQPTEQRIIMQNACREWAKNFSWDRAVAAYEALYERVATVDGALELAAPPHPDIGQP